MFLIGLILTGLISIFFGFALAETIDKHKGYLRLVCLIAILGIVSIASIITIS